MTHSLELACLATVLFDRSDTRYPNISAALFACDVNVLQEEGSTFRLGWVGVSSEGGGVYLRSSRRPTFNPWTRLKRFARRTRIATKRWDAALIPAAVTQLLTSGGGVECLDET